MLIEIPIDVWDPARGGAERYLARLAEELAARGHRVRFLCLRASPAAPGVGDRGARGIEAAIVPVSRWPRFWREIAFARAVEARRASRRPGEEAITLAVRHSLGAEVYQPHGGPYRVALRASLEGVGPAARRWAKLALRLLRPTTRVLLHLDRAVLLAKPPPVVVSLSWKVEEDFRRAYPGIPIAFERIPNGVDLEAFHDRDRPERSRELREHFSIPAGGQVALFVAHQFGPKGLADAVRALPLAPRHHLVVVGSGRRGPFESLARRLGVLDRLRFAGAVPSLREFHSASEVLVLPTRYDPCSLVLLEALACGTPVITTRANGAGELLTSGREGFVTIPGDHRALAAGMNAIAEDWKTYHDAAHRRSRDLSFARHFEAMLALLERAWRIKVGSRQPG